MASARYWRLVGILPYGGRNADLELFALHWYSGATRIDASAALICSHAPISGGLSTLQGTNPAQSVRFAAEHVRSAGFFIVWDFGAAVTDPTPRIGRTVPSNFLGWATLQYSPDGISWTTDMLFGRVIDPGAGALTASDPQFRSDAASDWDAASASNCTITGRSATVRSGPNGRVRTGGGRAEGRRVFGLRLDSSVPPQVFFAGLARLVGWGSFSTGRHWLSYAYDGEFYYYPSGSAITLSPAPGSATAVGDTIYFDIDFSAGTAALKKNGGAWSAPVALPNWVAGDAYVIELQAPSSSSASWSASLLTTAAELAGSIPSGAKAWDSIQDSAPFQDAVNMACGIGGRILSAASSPVPAPSCRSINRGLLARDAEFGGTGRVYGTTKAKGAPSNTPTKSRVRLIRERDGLLAREAWSDPATGAFEFRGIDLAQRWIVLAQDAAGAFRPVAASQIEAEAL
ncbi:hypothetical protein [Tibeticola sp.]|uniref:hypothetical protein n=1 Tax=Tibeticola sp. TaxID=2005368 RepID=UPI0025DF5DEB|nr:hypothetical protein [Tibeticola sp.]